MIEPARLWESIRAHAFSLAPPAFREGIEPHAFLAALADIESSFGRDLGPRYEAAFDKGGPLYHPKAFAAWGRASACSWGPWQIMGVVAWELGYKRDPQLLQEDPGLAGSLAVWYLNTRARGAQDLDELGAAYNGGNIRALTPTATYRLKLAKAYARRLEAREWILPPRP